MIPRPSAAAPTSPIAARSTRPPLILGFASERAEPNELIVAAEAAARDLGVPTRRVATEADEAEVDVLIAVGFPHHHPDLLRRRRRAHRVLWYGEPLATPGRGLGPAVLRVIPAAGIADAAMRALPSLARRRIVSTWRGRAAAERLAVRNLGEIARVAARFDDIAMTSDLRVRAAAAIGVGARVVPFGYHASTSGPLAPIDLASRDVPVLVLGTELEGHTRRAAILDTVRRALEPDVPVMLVGAGLYGEARTRLLRRTRVVLDVHRVPGNFAGVRLVMAAAAGAVFVTEPFTGPTVAVPNVHFVEARAERLADAVRRVVASDALARRTAEAAQDLLRTELAMATCLRRLAPIAT